MMQYSYSLKSTLQKVAFTERSMEKKLPALLGDYDRQTDQPIDQLTAMLHREGTLPLRSSLFFSRMSFFHHWHFF